MWAVNFVFHPKVLLKFHEVMLIEMYSTHSDCCVYVVFACIRR